MDGTVAGTKHVLALQRGSEAFISGSQLEEDLPLDIKAVIFSACLSVCVCACVSVCMVRVHTSVQLYMPMQMEDLRHLLTLSTLYS